MSRLASLVRFLRRAVTANERPFSLRSVSDRTAGTVVVGYFTTLSLLVFYPLLEPGYVLTLDMIFAPNADYLRFGLDTKGPLYYGRLPFLLVLDGLGLVLDDWIVQKLVLVSLPVASGLAMYVACDSRTRTAASFAGTLYAINPFVYVRLLAGHWYFLLGYAFVPLAVVAFDGYVDPDGDGSLARAVGWTTLVCVFDPHAAVLVAVAGGCLWVVRTDRARRGGSNSNPSAGEHVRRLGRFSLAAVAANAYWLLPSAVAALAGGTHLSTITGADLTAFSARGTVAGDAPLSVAMLYGFWRGAATTTFDVFPTWAVGLPFGGMVYLAVFGAIGDRTDPFVRGLVLASVVGFVLSLGVSTRVSELLFRTLVDVVPVLRGMRDSQKFVGLVVLGYALLGGRGVDGIVPHEPPAEGASVDVRRLARITLVVLLLVTPLAYTAPMFGGFTGQVDTTTYPESWHEANDRIAEDGTGRVLFLPWHQYISVSWTDRRIATPAELFFDGSVVAGHNIEVGGIETRASDPTRARVREALANPTGSAFGDRLGSVGIEYVILAHEADYRRYEGLSTHPEFTVAFEGDGITVYENEAYDAASSPWPRAGPPVPTLGLALGSVVSLVSVGLLVRTVVIGDHPR